MDSLEPKIQTPQEQENPTEETPSENKGLNGDSSSARIGEEHQAKIPNIQTDPIATCPLKLSPFVPISYVQPNIPLPLTAPSRWSESEKEIFLLGFYIFGKKLNVLRRFVYDEGRNGKIKTMGDVLAYYYTQFYKSEGYKRAKLKRCVIGSCIFTGWRQTEILTRLFDSVPSEEHGTLQEVFKSHIEENSTFEEFIFTLKAIAGTHALVQVIGIGKGKPDLTRIRPDPSRAQNLIQARLEIPTGNQWSSLSSDEILKFLNGSYRLSKARSNDLFWEAVWPRLLVQGWTSYQPKDHPLVFMVPGTQDFSRENLVKGIHYFDSVSDLLSKVVSDPDSIKLDTDVLKNNDNAINVGNNNAINIENIQPKIVNQEMDSIIKFTIVDTSIVYGGENFTIRSLRNLPLLDLNTSCEESLPRLSQSQSDTSASESSDHARSVKSEPVEIKNIIEDKKSKPVVKRRRLGAGKKEKENYENAPASESEIKGTCQPSIDLNLPDVKFEKGINDQEFCTKDMDVDTIKEGSSVQNNRRHGTRNRPPTTKALEALALGFIGSTKRKKNSELIFSDSNKPKQRARISGEKNFEGLCACSEIQSDVSLVNRRE